MRSVIKSAKTVDEAVTLALKEMGASRSEVEIEVLEESKAGFLGLFGSKDAIVKVTEKKVEKKSLNDIYDEERSLRSKKVEEKVKAPEKVEMPVETPVESPVKVEEVIEEKIEKQEEVKEVVAEEKVEAVAAVEEKEVQEKKTIDQVALDVQKTLEDLLVSMHIKATVETNVEGDGITYSLENISEEDTGIIIGRKGETLDSVQYILSLIANKDAEDFYRVTLDVAKYRERRKQSIENNARKTAFKVLKTKRSISLEPMNSYERRIVHYALQDYKELETVSQGNFPNRKVVIKYKG